MFLSKVPLTKKTGLIALLLVIFIFTAAGCSPQSMPSTRATSSTTLEAKPDHTGSSEIGPLAVPAFFGVRARNIVKTGGTFVRMDLDPISREIYYMDGSVNI